MSSLATVAQNEAIASQFDPELFGRALALAVEMMSIDPDQLWLEEELVERFIETRRSRHTREAYRRDIDHFRRWLHVTYGGAVSLAKVAYEHSDEYCRYLRECVSRDEVALATGVEVFSKATVNRRVSALSSFYGWASAARRRRFTGIHVNPVDFDLYKVHSNFNDRVLTEAQVLKLIDAAFCPKSKRVRYAARDGALIRLLYHTAMRVSELTSRQWKDLKRLERDDPRAGGVLTITGKGDKRRSVLVSHEVMELLEAIPGSHATDCPIFQTERGGELDRDTVSAILKRACRDAGVPEITPHVLRHTHATHYRDRGGDMVLLKEDMGHSSFDTTSGYIKANPTDSSGLHLVA